MGGGGSKRVVSNDSATLRPHTVMTMMMDERAVPNKVFYFNLVRCWISGPPLVGLQSLLHRRSRECLLTLVGQMHYCCDRPVLL